MSPRPIVGLLNRAARREPGFVGFNELIVETVEAADDVYDPMARTVAKFRKIEGKQNKTASPEDEQVIEQMMSIMRQLSFLRNRLVKILDRGML